MRFPDKEMFKKFEESDFGSIVSTMLVEGVIGAGYDFELGDSGEHVTLYPMIPGPAGMENLKADCHMVREALEKAIPKMSEDYKAFWVFMANDFDKNGVVMPMKGKIL